MNRYNFFILCLFLGLLPMMAAAQESVDGTVIDSETRHPISGVVVQALNKSGKATSFASSNTRGHSE